MSPPRGRWEPGRPRSARPVIAVVAVLALSALAVVAGCSGPPSRVGAAADQVVLRTFAVDAPGSPADLLRELVLRTATAPVSVRPSVAARAAADDEDAAVLKALRDDVVDVAVVRADALVGAGARSLTPLQLPLVHSREAADAVAASPLAAGLMADLPEIDLVGMALAPNGLRHPVGYGFGPLLAPSDYAGMVVNTRPGPGVEAIVQALGARSDHSVGEERARRVSSGVLRAVDVSSQLVGALGGPAVITADVTLYTRFDVVVLRRAAYAALTAAQRASLAAAVQSAVARAGTAREGEVQALRRWCDEGRSVWQAGPVQVAAFRAALAPLVERAQADLSWGPLVESLAALDGRFPPAPGLTCRPEVGPRGFAPRGDQGVLDGVWRLELRAQALVEARLPIDQNVGVWTFTIRQGLARVDQPSGPDCVSLFTFDGDRLTLDWSADGSGSCEGFLVGTYHRTGDTVRVSWQGDPSTADARFDAAMWSGGLHRIGDG